MNLNPNALVLWLIGACIGWLLNGGTGAVVGLLVCLVISLLASALPNRPRRRW